MSRELKFRLWNKKDNEWDSPAIVEVFSDDGILRPLYNDGDGGDWRNKYTIQQYTGLKDKNGKEIYDGDVVKVDRCRVVDGELVETGIETGNVFWADYFFQYRVSFDHIRYDDFEALMDNEDRYEVIGNIYENPELVKY